MVNLFERNPAALAPYPFLTVAYAAGNDHVDSGPAGQFQQFFDPFGVHSLQRAGVVSFACHRNHEGLCGEGTGLIDRDAHIALRDFAHDGAEKTDAPRQQFPERSQYSEKPRIDKRHQFSVVQLPVFDAFGLTLFRAVAGNVSPLEVEDEFRTLSVQILAGYENDDLRSVAVAVWPRLATEIRAIRSGCVMW